MCEHEGWSVFYAKLAYPEPDYVTKSAKLLHKYSPLIIMS